MRSLERAVGVVAVAALLILLLAAACAPRPSPTSTPAAELTPVEEATPTPPPPTATPTVTPSAEAARVERLTIAIPQDPGSPLNLYITSHSRFDFLMDLVHDRLFAPSAYVEDPVPWLAESATQLDELTWEVKLRPGIRWHDGQELTARDVKFTFEYFRDGPPNRHSHHVSDVPRIEEIEVVDPQTVRMVCAYPCPLLAGITLADLPILPEHIWSAVAEPRQYTELPVGTGPYRLVEYQPGSLLRFRANEDYFMGPPLVEELVMPIIKEPSSTFLALRTGQVDAAARPVPPELLGELGQLPDLKVVSTSALSVVEMRINYERPPFDRPEFRRALSLALDRQALVETVLLGHGRPGLQGYPHPDSPWTNPSLSTPFDRAQAEALLGDLGFEDRDGDGVREGPDGTPLRFTLMVTGTEPTWVRAAELVVEQLGEVGIAAKVESLDPAAIRELFRSRDFDMYITDMTPHGVADPDQFVMSHRSDYLWKAGLPYPEWDALFEEWREAATVEARKEVLFAMQELFNRQPTSLVLWYLEENWAYRPGAYALWAESPGYGIIHKWSLLPPELRGPTVLP